MLERQPEDRPVSQPATPASAPVPAAARAAVSPTALVLAAGGFGLSLIAGLPVAVAVGIGACGWALRVGVAGLVGARRRRRRERPEPIDPYAVPEPWRDFVAQSVRARSKFAQVVGQFRPGPLQERLVEVGGRVDDAVRECWRVAHLGAAVDIALADLDPRQTSADLRAVQEERGRLVAANPSTSTASLDQSEASLAARLQAGRRVEATRQRTVDRLRVATAQLDEAVGSTAELSFEAADAAAAEPLADHVEGVVGEIESLRQALEETQGPPTPRPAPPP